MNGMNGGYGYGMNGGYGYYGGQDDEGQWWRPDYGFALPFTRGMDVAGAYAPPTSYLVAGLIPGFSIHVDLKNIVKGKPILDVQSTFLHNASKAAGRAIGSASHTLDKVTGKISNAIKKVPVVGPLLHGAFQIEAAPFRVAEDIGRGQRIDKAALDGLKRTVSGVREVAPYAQSVISLVPGLGPPISAAIGGGLALAAGQSIGEAALTAAADAVPGGAFGKAAFDAGKAVVEHKNVAQVALSAAGDLGQAAGITVPPVAQQALGSGLKFAQDIASGKKPSAAALDAAVAVLPQEARAAAKAAGAQGVADALVQHGEQLIPNLTPEQRKGLQVGLTSGMALAHGKALQQITRTNLSSPSVLSHIVQAGQHATASDAVLHAARDTLAQGGEGVQGFDLAAGMMQHKVTPFELATARNGLRPEQRTGFDLATAVHIARVAGPKAPAALQDHPNAKLAYFATHGMLGTDPDHRAQVVSVVSAHPNGEQGALIAAKELEAAGVPTPDAERGIAPSVQTKAPTTTSGYEMGYDALTSDYFAAIEQLASEIMGHMGVVGISDDAYGVITVHTTWDVNHVRHYLGGAYEGFPVRVLPSSGNIPY